MPRAPAARGPLVGEVDDEHPVTAREEELGEGEPEAGRASGHQGTTRHPSVLGGPWG